MVVINLPTNAGSSQQTATINTDIQFPTGVSSSVPNTCDKIIGSLRTAGSKSAFMEQYKISSMRTNLQNFHRGLVGGGVNQLELLDADGNKIIKSGAGDYNAYLKTIEESQLPIQRLVATCLMEAVLPEPNGLEEAEKRLKVSQARYELISPDTERVSYYEGWFPLYRPVKESNIFILFGTSIVILIAAILQFLRMNGVELKLVVPIIRFDWPDFSAAKGYLFGGTLVAGIIVGVGISRGWFYF